MYNTKRHASSVRGAVCAGTLRSLSGGTLASVFGSIGILFVKKVVRLGCCILIRIGSSVRSSINTKSKNASINHEGDHNMKQWIVNAFRAGLRISCVISLIVFVNACNASPTPLPNGWHVVRTVEHVTPQEQIALWIVNNRAALAWAGAPDLPNLQLAQGDNPPLQLALGITPRQLTGMPLAHQWMQLLWLDQTMPGDVQLMGGTVDAAGELQRGPTAISNITTIEYAAVPTPFGGVAVLWSTPTRAGTAASAEVYLQLIDSEGRPLPAQRITPNGRFPALAYDLRGDLHVTWLASVDGRQWTLHHSLLAATLDLTGAVVADLPSSVIGAISLTADQSIDSICVTTDADTLYVLWSTLTIGGSAEANGLRAPLPQPSAVQPFTLTLAGNHVGQPSVAATPAASQYVSLIAMDESGKRVPVVGKLTATGDVELQSLADAAMVVSRPALATDDRGYLHLAWLRLEADGRSSLISLSNEP
jgi:hypothetical protein